MVPAPFAAAESGLVAAAAQRSVTCTSLSARLLAEIVTPVPHTKEGWGGYAGTASAWKLAHSGDAGRYTVSGSGRVFTLVERFSLPVTARLALASIVHALLPGKVRVVYALNAVECQQTIYMGSALGKLFGNPSLGAFAELSSGEGVGRTHYDANRVDRARITPLGRIGGEPCT